MDKTVEREKTGLGLPQGAWIWILLCGSLFANLYFGISVWLSGLVNEFVKSLDPAALGGSALAVFACAVAYWLYLGRRSSALEAEFYQSQAAGHKLEASIDGGNPLATEPRDGDR